MRYTHCTDCNKEKLTYKTQKTARCSSCSRKGHAPTFTTTHSAETRLALSEMSRGRPVPIEQRIQRSIRQGGTGILGKNKHAIPGLGAWSKAVKERDGACIDCGSTERLEAHHLIMKAKFPEVATELWNGITLCRKCHIAEHKIIGKK